MAELVGRRLRLLFDFLIGKGSIVKALHFLVVVALLGIHRCVQDVVSEHVQIDVRFLRRRWHGTLENRLDLQARRHGRSASRRLMLQIQIFEHTHLLVFVALRLEAVLIGATRRFLNQALQIGMVFLSARAVRRAPFPATIEAGYHLLDKFLVSKLRIAQLLARQLLLNVLALS